VTEKPHQTVIWFGALTCYAIANKVLSWSVGQPEAGLPPASEVATGERLRRYKARFRLPFQGRIIEVLICR
jgi:hypothetical protein